MPTIPTTYKYEVYNFLGEYIMDFARFVKSEFDYSHEINTAFAQLPIDLAFPVSRSREAIEPITDESGNNLTDESNNIIYINRQPEYFEYVFQENNRVRVYEYSNDDPNGILAFDGKISSFGIDMDNGTISLVVLSLGADMNQIYLEDGGNTTITMVDTKIGTMMYNLLVYYGLSGGVVNQDIGDIKDSAGAISSYSFINMTMFQGALKCQELADSEWYFYVPVAGGSTNIPLTFQATPTTASHIFAKGNHITGLNIVKSLEQIINTVFFIGGDIGGGVNLLKKYYDAGSIERYGIRSTIVTDPSVTTENIAAILALNTLQAKSQPTYEATVTISRAKYDIASIQIGQVVGFANHGNMIDSLLLQIVGLRRQANQVILRLGNLPRRASRDYEVTKRSLLALQTVANPTAPS